MQYVPKIFRDQGQLIRSRRASRRFTGSAEFSQAQPACTMIVHLRSFPRHFEYGVAGARRCRGPARINSILLAQKAGGNHRLTLDPDQPPRYRTEADARRLALALAQAANTTDPASSGIRAVRPDDHLKSDLVSFVICSLYLIDQPKIQSSCFAKWPR
jgi:hypothetical protein